MIIHISTHARVHNTRTFRDFWQIIYLEYPATCFAVLTWMTLRCVSLSNSILSTNLVQLNFQAENDSGFYHSETQNFAGLHVLLTVSVLFAIYAVASHRQLDEILSASNEQHCAPYKFLCSDFQVIGSCWNSRIARKQNRYQIFIMN